MLQKECRLASISDFNFWHFPRSKDTACKKSSSGGRIPVLSIETNRNISNESTQCVQMKWSRTLPSFTLSLNSSCRSTSRVTVSKRGFTISACLTPFRSSLTCATPGEKQATNLSASSLIIGERISMVGNNRYDAVAHSLAKENQTFYLLERIWHDLVQFPWQHASEYQVPAIKLIQKKTVTCPCRSLAMRISSCTGLIGLSLNHIAWLPCGTHWISRL